MLGTSLLPNLQREEQGTYPGDAEEVPTGEWDLFDCTSDKVCKRSFICPLPTWGQASYDSS